jgi:hypothetical protein
VHDRRPRSAPMKRVPRKHMTIERANEIMLQTTPRLTRKTSPTRDGRKRLPASPMLTRTQQHAAASKKSRPSSSVDPVSASARFQVLRLNDYVDMPDVPTELLGAREKAKQLFLRLQKDVEAVEKQIHIDSRHTVFQKDPLTALYQEECDFPEWHHLQLSSTMFTQYVDQIPINEVIEEYNAILKVLLPIYQRMTAQCAVLCKERGEVMAGTWMAYMSLVKHLCDGICSRLGRQLKTACMRSDQVIGQKNKEIETLTQSIEGLNQQTDVLKAQANEAFLEQSDFVGATEDLVSTVKDVSRDIMHRLTQMCTIASESRADTNRPDKLLTGAEINLDFDRQEVEGMLANIAEIEKSHPSERCRATARLSEATQHLVGRVTQVMDCIALNERYTMTKVEHKLKVTRDEAQRLKELSEGLQRQVDEQTKRLVIQDEQIETLGAQVKFYTQENVTYRAKIKELETDVQVAEETIRGYELLLDDSTQKQKGVNKDTQTENDYDKEDEENKEIDFIKLAAQGFQLQPHIPKAKKIKKKKKADRDPESTIAKYMAAHGCFFGALARASKPPRKVFLRRGKKKTDDQNVVRIIPFDQLQEMVLDIILAKVEADRNDDRMCFQRQNMTDFIYDYFLNKYGAFKMADERVVVFMASVSTHRNESSRIRMLERFCELGPGPFLSTDHLHFYMNCWGKFSGLHNQQHGPTWHKIISGEKLVETATAKLILKQTIVKSTLDAEKAEALGPYVVRMNGRKCDAVYERIVAMLPAKVDTFMDMMVAEQLQAGQQMEKELHSVFKEATAHTRAGMTLEEFRLLLKKIDPSLPQIRIASLYHTGLEHSHHDIGDPAARALDFHGFQHIVRSSRRLLQYVSEGIDAVHKAKEAIARKNREDLAELALEWKRALPKLESELYILASAGAEVVGDDKWYNRAMQYKHEFEKALSAATEVNDAGVAWAAYTHLLNAVEGGLESVSQEAVARAKAKQRKASRHALSRDTKMKKAQRTTIINVGASAFWQPKLSSTNRHKFRPTDHAEQ